MIRQLLLLFLLVFISGSSTLLTAQTDTTITGNGTIILNVIGGVSTDYNIIMPANCTANITYQAWGGGGAGGVQAGNAVGGGGSGAYLNCTVPIALDCDMTYSVTVGTGGIADTDPDGKNTVVNFGTSSTAGGGVGGGNNGGVGGTGSGCGFQAGNTGENRFNSNRNGGDGADAPGTIGGLGGDGGDNTTNDPAGNTDGMDGATPGGGGGGHSRDSRVDPANDPLTLKSGNGGDGQIIIVVTDYECINASAGADQVICEGETATLTGSVTMGTALSYAWSNGAGVAMTSVTPATTTTYTVTVTDANGCTDTDDVTVTVNSFTINAPTITVCTGETVTDLTSYNNIVLNEEIGTVTWFNQDPATTGTTITNPAAFDLTTLTATTDLWAKVTLSDGTGCMETINVPINIVTCNKWTGEVDNNWETAGNWSTGVAPVTADNVLINKSGAIITASSRVNVGGLLTVGPCVTLEITGPDPSAILLVTGSLINNGDIIATNTTTRRAMFVTGPGYVLNNGNIEAINDAIGIDNRGFFTNNGVVISDNDLHLVDAGFTNNAGGEVFTGTETFGGTGATTVKTGEVADAVKLIMTAPTATTTTLEVCDSNNDNIAEFTLTDADATVLGGQTGLTVSYHLTQLDADCNSNPLSSPYENTTATCQTIYARVGLSASGCYATVPVTLKVINGIDLVDAPFIICETETTTDLSEHSGKILNGHAGTITWFDGTPSTGTLLSNTTNLNNVGDLWAKVTLSSAAACMDSIDITTTIKTNCITWTGAANDDNWDTGTNWSSGSVPSDTDCIKINNSDCPITKTGGLSVGATGLLAIGEGVRLILTGGGLTVDGKLDNSGTITVEPGNTNGVVINGEIDNAACATIITEGSVRGLFVTTSAVALVNAGFIESTGGTDGIDARDFLFNTGTIIATPKYKIVSNSSTVNNGQIFSFLDPTINGTLSGNAFEPLGTCPTISSTVTDVCVGAMITIAANKGTFASDNPTIAAVDPTSGVVTGNTVGTAKITVTDGTCTIQRIVTVHPQPTPATPTIGVCDMIPSNLTTNNTTILDGELGSITWYNKEPANGGTIITNATVFDINTLAAPSDLWAIVTLDDCSACMDTVNIPFTIFCPTISITDPCSCRNPNNATLSDGTVLFQDILKVDASTVANPTVILTAADANFLDVSGNPINPATATFIDLGNGVFGLEFYTTSDMPATITVDVNGVVQDFTTESCSTIFTTSTWNGDGDGTTWTDPDNWSNDVVPNRNTEVRFTSSAYVIGTPPNAIDRLRISGNADVSFQLTNLTVSRIGLTGTANSVDIIGGSSLSLVTGEYLFTTDAESCNNINDIMRVRSGSKFNVNRGVQAIYRTGGAPKGTTRDALVVEDENSCVVNCGLILIDGGFTGNGITVDDGSSFYNNGNITIEPVITGSSILVTNQSSFINECLAVIYNNNISNSKITINRESFFRNFGFIKSSNPNGAGISVVQGGNRAESVLFNYGYFYNKNNFARIATGSGAVVDEGQRTTIDNLHDLLTTPGVEFTRCSGANLGCGSDTINPIPTMNEWGLLIFALLILNLGIFFISRKEGLITYN